jgi:diguanylate cyclase (GGDEF)-like protein
MTLLNIYKSVGEISKRGVIIPMFVSAVDILEMFRKSPSVSEVSIVNEKNAVLGMMTRSKLHKAFSGQYGYSLNYRKKAVELMDTDFLEVDSKMPIDVVSQIAMTRESDRIYDSIVVVSAGQYFGVVSVKDLLESAISIETSKAKHMNPLTGLSGNVLIEKRLKECLSTDRPYCILYIDIDNFKAYNDVYGFENGDMMIKLLSDILKSVCSKNEFIGHIGGDDFVVIADYSETENICNCIINRFAEGIRLLYSKDDIENGFIVTQNRHGITEKFSLSTLSIAGLDNKQQIIDMNDFSYRIAKLKKKCKQLQGNSYIIN